MQSWKFNPWTVFCPLYVRVCLASLYPRDLGNSYTHALEVSTPLDTFRPLFMHVCLASCIRSDLGNSYIHALEVSSLIFALWLSSVTFEQLMRSSMSTPKFSSNISFELLYLSRPPVWPVGSIVTLVIRTFTHWRCSTNQCLCTLHQNLLIMVTITKSSFLELCIGQRSPCA